MYDPREVIVSRATSAIPVSIGTSLALESILAGIAPPYDPDRVIPEMISLDDYAEIWINCATLVRNIVGAVPAEQAKVLQPKHIAECLYEEIDIINTCIREQTSGRVKAVFYQCEYGALKTLYPRAAVREPATPKQMEAAKLNQLLVNHFKARPPNGAYFRTFSPNLEPDRPVKALVITHIAYDLCSYRRFTKLDLLESHTGARKARAAWYTKLSNSKDTQNVPFGPFALQVFGDSNNFAPSPMAVRKAVLEMAKEHNWTSLTTKDRIRLCVQLLPSGDVKNLLTAFAAGE
jgi:hypothetical protein